MERNNFKELIQNGQVTPSESSWEKLSERLSSHEKKNRNSKTAWLKYVASFALLLSLGSYFLKLEKEVIEGNNVVKPELKSPTTETSDATTKKIVIESFQNEKLPTVNVVKNPSNSANLVTINEKKNLSPSKDAKSEPTELKDVETAENLTKDPINHNSLLSENKIATDQEIDLLLKNALLNIDKNDTAKEKYKINGNSLLGEVEYEIEHEYKRKLFEKVIISLNRPKAIELTDRSK